MHKYVAEECDRCEQRVFFVAQFLCDVWQHKPDALPGALFVAAVEAALRRAARANIIFATEALKAIFAQLLHDSLEHEEQHSPVQLASLGLRYEARWFGRGAAEAFAILRWAKGEMTPAALGRLRHDVRQAFAAPLAG